MRDSKSFWVQILNRLDSLSVYLQLKCARLDDWELIVWNQLINYKVYRRSHESSAWLVWSICYKLSKLLSLGCFKLLRNFFVPPSWENANSSHRTLWKLNSIPHGSQHDISNSLYSKKESSLTRLIFRLLRPFDLRLSWDISANFLSRFINSMKIFLWCRKLL